MNIGSLGPPPYLTPYLNQEGILSPNWSRWINQLYTGLNQNYASSYFGTTAKWTASSATFVDPTNSVDDTLTSIKSNVTTLTAASSSKLGVAFTPPSVSSLYLINVQLNLTSAATWVAGKLWDGTTLIAYGNSKPMTLSGFYSPGTTEEVEVTVRLAAASGSVVAEDLSGLTSPAIFSVTQLR